MAKRAHHTMLDGAIDEVSSTSLTSGTTNPTVGNWRHAPRGISRAKFVKVSNCLPPDDNFEWPQAEKALNASDNVMSNVMPECVSPCDDHPRNEKNLIDDNVDSSGDSCCSEDDNFLQTADSVTSTSSSSDDFDFIGVLYEKDWFDLNDPNDIQEEDVIGNCSSNDSNDSERSQEESKFAGADEDKEGMQLFCKYLNHQSGLNNQEDNVSLSNMSQDESSFFISQYMSIATNPSNQNLSIAEFVRISMGMMNAYKNTMGKPQSQLNHDPSFTDAFQNESVLFDFSIGKWRSCAKAKASSKLPKCLTKKPEHRKTCFPSMNVASYHSMKGVDGCARAKKNSTAFSRIEENESWGSFNVDDMADMMIYHL